MKKCLLFAALLMVLQDNYLRAQNLFEAPDTVCPKQMVQLRSNYPSASSHYWGFCSGYLLNKPVPDNLRDTFVFWENATGIETAEDKDRYYGFVIYREGDSGGRFVKLEFGNSFRNTPKVIDYGNMGGVLPFRPNCMYLLKTEDSNWHIFIGGSTSTFAPASLARIDFGKDLGNTPNIVNFGNPNNQVANPIGIFVTKEPDNKWYGFAINSKTTSSEMIRIEFDSNISFTPTITNLGVVADVNGSAALYDPHDMAPVRHNGLWHFFVTNRSGSTLARIDMGNSLALGTPVVTTIGNLLGAVSQPTGISYIRDCDSMYLFVTNRANNTFARVDMPSPLGPYTARAYDFELFLKNPSALSPLVRDRDRIFCFAPNIDSSITRITFDQCKNASIAFSTNNVPPAYSYDTAGTYNIYYAINEGKPDMEVECQLITVLPTPPLFLSPSDTVICQGDTIYLRAFSVNALSYTWSPDINLSATDKSSILAWPEYPITYNLHMPFPHNCIIDTPIKVYVNRVKADAGPDRTIADGASTILGGPYTTTNYDPAHYLYIWSPDQYIDDIHSLNPVVRPPYDFTYTLRVVDKSNSQAAPCASVDTVIVRVQCTDVNLPNAFIPGGGNNTRATFGLANQQIVKLNYFQIFDRWGKLVFTAGDENSADPTKEWDGTVDGADAPMGVYVWQADGFCASGQRVRKSGNVTLIR